MRPLVRIAKCMIAVSRREWPAEGAAVLEIELSQEDLEQLMRPVAGSGGWQSLLRKLQKQVDGRRLALSESDSKRLLRYILSYGSGGWQDRLAAMTRRRGRARTAPRQRSVRTVRT